jgi:phosphonatase-like hydrolase
MQTELVVFDLAGTTVKDNCEIQTGIQHALKKYGIVVSKADVNSVMGISKPIAIRRLLEMHYAGGRGVSEQWVESIYQYFVKNMIDYYLNDSSVCENNGASETFYKLRREGIRVYLDTGFDRDIAAPLVKRMGWMDKELVNGILTTDSDISGRPYPVMIYKAMKLAGVSFSYQVAKVGDTPADLMQGDAAGCGWVIGITTGSFTEQQLSEAPHTHLIQEIPEVLSVLGVHSKSAVQA